jgi:hypothetical protein
MQITTSDFTPFIPPPPPVIFVPAPLPFNQAIVPVAIGASAILRGDIL